MSFQAVEFVLAQHIPSSPQKLLLVAIAHHVDRKTGKWTMKQSDLVADATMSIRQVKEHAAALEDAKRIVRDIQRTSDGSPEGTEYTLVGYAEWMAGAKESAIPAFEAARAKLEQNATQGAKTRTKDKVRKSAPKPNVNPHAGHTETRTYIKVQSDYSPLQSSLSQQVATSAGGASLFEGEEAQSSQTAKTSKRKPKREAYSATFEAAWIIFPEYRGTSKKNAFAQWQAEGCDECLEAVMHGIRQYTRQIARDTRPDRTRAQHMERWIKARRWESYEPENAAAAAPDPVREQELQVKAVALDLEKGEVRFAAKWWQNLNDVPGRIMQAARELMEARNLQAQAA